MKKKQPPQLNGLSGSLTHFYQLGALLLRKGVKCHSPIQQLFSASSSFVFFYLFIVFFFQLYMYLFGYDFNNLKQRQAEYFFFIEILTSVLTIQSSISQFEFLFEQLSTIKLFQCFHIQMVVVPFLRNNPSAVMFFQRFIFPAKTLWEKYSERIWVFHCK